jgi:hypothetical protein
LSEKENIREIFAAGEQPGEEDAELFLDIEESFGEGEIAPEKLADLARKAPEPSVTGNEQIEILSHSLVNKKGREEGAGKGVAIGLKNIAGSNIGKAVFEVVFYDTKGNVVDTVEQSISDFEKDKTRTLRIESSKAESIDIKSYDVKMGKVVVTPVPTVTGDDRIHILKHNFQDVGSLDVGISQLKSGIELAVRNVSGVTVATAIFEAEVYDSGGNVLTTVNHKECEIKPNTSRAFLLTVDKVKEDKARSYSIKVIKTVTTDVEKVQLRRNEKRAIAAVGEEISGILKNISDIKTDAVLVATFLDAKQEKVGMRVLAMKDIEPNSIRKFSLIFTPPPGEVVKTYSLDIGEMIEGEVTDAVMTEEEMKE